MAQDEWDSMLGAEISEPIPCEHTFYSDNNVFSKRFDQLEKDFPIGFNVLVQPDLSSLIHDAKIHFPCMKVDSAIKFMLFVVKFHLAPPFLWIYDFGLKLIISYFAGGLK